MGSRKVTQPGMWHPQAWRVPGSAVAHPWHRVPLPGMEGPTCAPSLRLQRIPWIQLFHDGVRVFPADEPAEHRQGVSASPCSPQHLPGKCLSPPPAAWQRGDSPGGYAGWMGDRTGPCLLAPHVPAPCRGDRDVVRAWLLVGLNCGAAMSSPNTATSLWEWRPPPRAPCHTTALHPPMALGGQPAPTTPRARRGGAT